MAILALLVKGVGWGAIPAKFCSAELAMLNNFVWNEIWTFRGVVKDTHPTTGRLRRLAKFHAICGAGILLAVFLLHVFYTWLGFNLFLSNFLAIVLVTLWNFCMNAFFNWPVLAN